MTDDSYRDAVLSVGSDGQVGKLTLLHPNVPVSVDLLTTEHFLPAVAQLEELSDVRSQGWKSYLPVNVLVGDN